MTTSAQITARLSATGLALRVDHSPVAATAEAISAASEDIAFYLGSRYLIADLPASGWVASKATAIAIYYLSLWRNNGVPKSVQTLYDAVLKELQAVQSGKGNVPGLAPGKILPQIITQRTSWGEWPHERLIPTATTGTSEGIVEYTDPFEPPPNAGTFGVFP